MNTSITLPTDQDLTYAAQMLALASQVCQEKAGAILSGSDTDFPLIQSTLDSSVEPKLTTVELQSLGLALGLVFTNAHPEYDWWMIDDEKGRNLCIRYASSALLFFPQTIISKRVEEGETLNIAALYQTLEQQLTEAATQIDKKACA